MAYALARASRGRDAPGRDAPAAALACCEVVRVALRSLSADVAAAGGRYGGGRVMAVQAASAGRGGTGNVVAGRKLREHLEPTWCGGPSR